MLLNFEEFISKTCHCKKNDDGSYSDFGIILWDDNTKYVGNIKESLAHGLGIYKAINGLYFKGHFDNEKAKGFGQYINPSLGVEYIGYWAQNYQHEYGIIVIIL